MAPMPSDTELIMPACRLEKLIFLLVKPYKSSKTIALIKGTCGARLGIKIKGMPSVSRTMPITIVASSRLTSEFCFALVIINSCMLS